MKFGDLKPAVVNSMSLTVHVVSEMAKTTKMSITMARPPQDGPELPGGGHFSETALDSFSFLKNPVKNKF